MPAVVMGGIILLITMGFILYLFSGTKKEAAVTVEGDKIAISGQYGVTYDIGDVSDVQLVDNVPPIGRKVNGAGLGEIKKGNFEVSGLGKCRLFIHSGNGPYIYLIVNGEYTIINF
jgi:hypothetical protein